MNRQPLSLTQKFGITVLACAITTLAASPALADKKSHRGPDRGMFERVDSDSDGYISSAEHAAGVAAMTAKMNQRFADMDADSDGRVSKEEAEEHHRAMRAERRDKYREERD
ncbi:MAG: hypothetical protein ACN4EJ_02170 [Porticoccaceae bacterium]